jgi:CxxC motif-containing protein (DUF1111 family)
MFQHHLGQKFTLELNQALTNREGAEMYLRAVLKMFFGLAIPSVLFSMCYANEAPTGDGNSSNGVLSASEFSAAVTVFNQTYAPQTGLGPIFNDISCGHCHNAPTVGGGGATLGHRAGFLVNGSFQAPPSGSLIDTRSLNPRILPVAPTLTGAPLGASIVTAFRSTLNTLGDGYVEAVPDSTLIEIANAQPGQSNQQIHGYVNYVPLLESPNIKAVGRFGWKSQHASLVSFSADAFRNEMGITTVLFPNELTTNVGLSSDENALLTQNFEPINPATGLRFQLNEANISDPQYQVVQSVANLMRSTPARQTFTRGNSASIASARVGQASFKAIGCAICHVPTLVTAAEGRSSQVLGGTYSIPPALANLTFHPYSDYLLHDVGTGDGILMDGADPTTSNMLRTAPLWGLSKRKAYLHDNSKPTVIEAINAHGGESTQVINQFKKLSSSEQQNILNFLNTL